MTQFYSQQKQSSVWLYLSEIKLLAIPLLRRKLLQVFFMAVKSAAVILARPFL